MGHYLGTGGSGVGMCGVQGMETYPGDWGGGSGAGHGSCPGDEGGVPGATTRLGVELFTFFVAGTRDKDILVGKSKIVGLGV